MVGVAIGMALTPILADSMSIANVQLVYGALAAASAIAFLALAREKPATPPSPPGMEERALMLDGLKHALTVRPFLVMLGIAFIVWGLQRRDHVDRDHTPARVSARPKQASWEL
jgi:hypothetical protein